MAAVCCLALAGCVNGGQASRDIAFGPQSQDALIVVAVAQQAGQQGVYQASVRLGTFNPVNGVSIKKYETSISADCKAGTVQECARNPAYQVIKVKPGDYYISSLGRSAFDPLRRGEYVARALFLPNGMNKGPQYMVTAFDQDDKRNPALFEETFYVYPEVPRLGFHVDAGQVAYIGTITVDFERYPAVVEGVTFDDAAARAALGAYPGVAVLPVRKPLAPIN